MNNTALLARPLGKRILRGVSAVIAVSALATGFVGFLHTKAGHPLLMKLAGIAGCPMGATDAATAERVRRAATAHDRGASPAPSRPALGFALEGQTLADVRAWEERHAITCSEEREGTLVRCNDVPAEVLGRPATEPPITELMFGFSLAGKLDAVTILESERSAELARASAQRTAIAMKNALGEPQVAAGSFDAAGTTATVRYRYADYAADLTMTKITGSGCVVRERYAAVPRS